MAEAELEGPLAEFDRRRLHRAVDPTLTLARVRPLLRGMGITRIANITGLDRVGIPVVNVYRPNARSNALSQGKGLDLDAAKASGVMEAIETHCAERILHPLKLARATEMARHHLLPDLAALPRPKGSRFTEESQILWIEGRDLMSDGEIWLPMELVHADFTLPAASGAGQFLLSTSGLASGNVLAEAISHGIAEVIERDAAGRTVVRRLTGAELAVGVWDMTTDVGIAAFCCRIVEAADGPAAIGLPAAGYGCHPNRSVALLRALTEAAQARLSAISGARDDIGPDMYRRPDDPELVAQRQMIVSSSAESYDFKSVPDKQTNSVDEDLTYQLAALRGAGLDQVIVVDLSPADSDAIAVARVVVPGLEPPPQASCLPGRRARAAAGRRR
jgi:ribosomal protein S12 methylthiotransferase accessory factor YcaO